MGRRVEEIFMARIMGLVTCSDGAIRAAPFGRRLCRTIIAITAVHPAARV
jgi:hypothetical protein